jgi:hypothetical protein
MKLTPAEKVNPMCAAMFFCCRAGCCILKYFPSQWVTCTAFKQFYPEEGKKDEPDTRSQ